MNRRELITLAGGAATWPVVAWGRQAKMPLIGYLSVGGPLAPTEFAAFRKGLGTQGFAEGRNCAVMIRSAEQYDEIPAIIAEFSDLRVSVICPSGSANGAIAARVANMNIPVVFAIGSDPVQIGLVASMNRPGGNMTGVTFMSDTLLAKRLELVRELVPSVSLIAFLVNPSNERAEKDVDEIRTAAQRLGQKVMIAQASESVELETAFTLITERGAGALVVAGDSVFVRRPDQIIALATRYRLPAIFNTRGNVESGGLISYGDNRTETFRQFGVYVGRILNGESPSNLPVLQPSLFELVINQKAAKAIGLIISPMLLTRADEVIE